jgi:AcrR family transcriptional regulator
VDTVERTEAPNRDDARLRAAEACCDLYISRGTTDLTIAEIAAEIGISQRTFYRYFAIKAESVKPVFDWTTATFNHHVATAPDAPLREVLTDGFDVMLGGDHAERTRRLFPLIFADPELWSMFLRAVHYGETSLAPALARRLGVPSASIRSRAAAAAVATATRLALEDLVVSGADPAAAFASYLDAFGLGSPTD